MANGLRTTFWDSVKGIAIVAVIIIHASDPLLAQAPWSPEWILGLVLNQFLDFAVPLFLAMSGFFAVVALARLHDVGSRIIDVYDGLSLVPPARRHCRRRQRPEVRLSYPPRHQPVGPAPCPQD